MVDVLVDVFRFLIKRKKYWLIPVTVFLILLGALIIYSQGTVIAPFVYSLF